MIKADFELWKDIKSFEGLYQVSTWARVRSLDRWVVYKNGVKRFFKGKILKIFYYSSGYYMVELNKKCKKKYLLHRLVAEAFIPNPDNLPCVNHKDEDKTNNYPYNLEYCTHKYNNNYGTRMKRISKKLSKKVYQYDLNGNFIKSWSSTVELEKEGFNSSHISSCCLKKSKTHKGYIWSYKPIENFDIDNYKKKTTSKTVYQYDKDYNLIKIWYSTTECHRNGFDFRNISACCLGKRKTHKGYIWSYTELA